MIPERCSPAGALNSKLPIRVAESSIYAKGSARWSFLVTWVGTLLLFVAAHASTVTSVMPASYSAGTDILVELEVVPDAAVQVYAVEDAPPLNWGVTQISSGGVWDPATGRIKWGVFTDGNVRVLSYHVMVPLGVTGIAAFAGIGSFDGNEVTVGGVRRMGRFAGTVHRTMPADYVPGIPLTMTLGAIPATDSGVWGLEDRFPAGWTVDSINLGGVLDVESGKVKWGPFTDAAPRVFSYRVTPPATVRQAGVFQALAQMGVDGVVERGELPLRASVLSRSMASTYRPGVALDVVLRGQPAGFIQVWALEEEIPVGWEPVGISAGGTWDAANRKLKWGPFSGPSGAEQILGYQVIPALDATQPLRVTAFGIFDDARQTNGGLALRYLVHPQHSIVRTLPSAYRPGAPFSWSIRVDPIDTTSVYAVEERVPVGWAVSGLDQGGVFDEANSVVRWGPFLDSEAIPRVLGGSITPPVDSVVPGAFNGLARLDGLDVAVGGLSEVAAEASTVHRTLGASFQWGVSKPVTLRVQPLAGISAYAVVESIPPGWTVGSISHGGALDTVRGELKWGPFTDSTPRTLQYLVTPPASPGGSEAISWIGSGWFDGVSFPAQGDLLTQRNYLPVAQPDSFNRISTVRVAKVRILDVLANDTDADGNPLQVVDVSAATPPGSTVQIVGPWLVHTMPAGAGGNGGFTYTVSDGIETATATVTLVASNPPETPAPAPFQILLQQQQVLIAFSGVPTRLYRVQYTEDSAPPYRWTEFNPPANFTAPANGIFLFQDLQLNQSMRLYRGRAGHL